MLGMISLMPSSCFARGRSDTLVLNRVWNYSRDYMQSNEGTEKNVYMIHTFNVLRRNPTLFLVPTMYSIAKGDRDYVAEAYYKMTLHDGTYDLKRQVTCGTIPHNREVMSAVQDLMCPNFYNETLYKDKMLSPFYYSNRFFYKYRIINNNGYLCIIRFRPRTDNTQLIKGTAIVDAQTGRIHSVSYDGDYDMVSFNVAFHMAVDSTHVVVPAYCKIESTFKFLGNHIKAAFNVHYNCPTTLPDSIRDTENRKLMETLRPNPLQEDGRAIYQQFDQEQAAHADSLQKKQNHKFRDFMWNVVGYNLLNSQHADAGALSMRVSPLLNPLYFGYSKSHGLSYKLDFGFQYRWNAHRYLTLNPMLGYNFKKSQFYYKAPLRMTYNPKRNGYVELTWANGNRISSETLTNDIRYYRGEDINLPEFRDMNLQLVNNIEVFNWLEMTVGMVFHRRTSTDEALMNKLDIDSEFRSFAPLVTLRFRPWQNGPVLTANYEQSLKKVLKSDLKYERWEFDLSYKHKLPALRSINMRAGTGFYTQRNTNYFVDYTNFRDNNLPTGWDDEWTGQFQLLESRWYNESNYYFRTHVSFESPLLALTWVPGIGRLLEMERVYASVLSIEHTRPYIELGYGFTNRFFSAGLFTSFLNTKFQHFGCRFTVELFRRW